MNHLIAMLCMDNAGIHAIDYINTQVCTNPGTCVCKVGFTGSLCNVAYTGPSKEAVLLDCCVHDLNVPSLQHV